MEPQPLFNDLFGVMAVICMVPVFFLWLERKTRWKIFDFLPAIIWTYTVAGGGDFVSGGFLAGHIEGPAVGLLLGLFVFGIGKAAVMPVHRWLPAAMVARQSRHTRLRFSSRPSYVTCQAKAC